jgi:glycolate oxidase FAD binding subunit
MSSTCTIDGHGPYEVVSLQSVAELSDLVRKTAADRALYPLGGRTMLDIGLPPSKPGIGVDLRNLTQVVDYPARDMTITVQAGITIARLQELLRTEKQRLPIDVPAAEQATLGGILAANVSGSRRFGFGTLRDYVIGISVVNDEGHETKAGGRVVKNVAGYDLCKLHIGALGTLGIITQVTLKLRPIPEETALCCLGVETEALPAQLDRISTSQTRPICIDVLKRSALGQASLSNVCSGAGWLLVVGFEENRDAVAWQVQRLQEELAPAKLEVRRGADAASIWNVLTESSLRGDARLSFKANVLPHAVADFCRKAEGLSSQLAIQAHAGNGIVVGHLLSDCSLEEAQPLLQTLRDLAVAEKGNLVLRRCPTEWKKPLLYWGAPREDHWLMRTVREKLDPHQRFNPGRFV